jgi:hypothetical protein
MTRGDSEQLLFMLTVWKMYNAENLFEFSKFVATLVGCNTSGTSSTALKNVIFNWAAWGYGMELYYNMPPEVAFEMMLVEGDDNKNDLQSYPIPAVFFERLGLYTKMEVFIHNPLMPFCQQRIAMLTAVSIKDPRCIIKGTKVRLQYCAAKPKVMKELLRAQALSWYAEADGTPVVSVIAQRIIDLTEGIFVRKKTMLSIMPYHQSLSDIQFKPRKYRAITEECRMLVEQAFDFPVYAQLEFEEKIRAWSLGALDLPLDCFPDEWVDYWNDYVKPMSREQSFTYVESDLERGVLEARLAAYPW